MERITIEEFAKQVIHLTPGAFIRFLVTDEDRKTCECDITLVQVTSYCCILADCVSGGHPLRIYATEGSLMDICETLDKYINGNSGNYGNVDVIGISNDGKEFVGETTAESGRYMLISVVERKITTAFFPTHEKAYARMELELDKTMGDIRDAYNLDDDYGIDENSAWSDADDNAISDWLIVEINGETAMNKNGNPKTARLSVHMDKNGGNQV